MRFKQSFLGKGRVDKSRRITHFFISSTSNNITLNIDYPCHTMSRRVLSMRAKDSCFTFEVTDRWVTITDISDPAALLTFMFSAFECISFHYLFVSLVHGNISKIISMLRLCKALRKELILFLTLQDYARFIVCSKQCRGLLLVSEVMIRK